MSDTNFMSYSDAETVVTGIADKYKTFKGTQAQWDALSLSEKVKYSFADITDDYAGTGVVDAITDGDMNPVSSNAVYDYINNKVFVINQGSETVKSMLTRLWQLIDFSKMTNTSTLIRGREVYHVITKGTSSGKDAIFTRTIIGATSAVIEKIFINETNSEFSENTITSGNLSHADKSSSTGYDSFALYYR